MGTIKARAVEVITDKKLHSRFFYVLFLRSAHTLAHRFTQMIEMQNLLEALFFKNIIYDSQIFEMCKYTKRAKTIMQLLYVVS